MYILTSITLCSDCFPVKLIVHVGLARMLSSIICCQRNLLDNSLIIVFAYLASCKFDALLALTGLIVGVLNPALISIVPLCFSATFYKKAEHKNEFFRSYVFILLCILMMRYNLSWLHSSGSWANAMNFTLDRVNIMEWLELVQKSFLDIWETKLIMLYYTPSLGIRWYLDAQMIPEYGLYFEFLFAAIPMLCSSILYHTLCPQDLVCAVRRRSYAVICKDHFLPNYFSLTNASQIDLSAAIVILFRREISIVDILFGLGLLLQYPQVVRKMRHLPFIATGIVVPLILSPLMFVLWVDYGTGNANYFFFQGVCLWLFAALGIAEFTNAVLMQ